jgi:hypothetical protein
MALMRAALARRPALAEVETPKTTLRFWRNLFQGLRVGGLGVLLRELAMILGGPGVLLRLFVFTHRVVVLGLEVVMRGRLVMTSCGLVVLRRGMFRHLSAPLLRTTSDRKSLVQTFP